MSALTTSHWIPDGSGPPLLEGAIVGSRLREVAAEVPDRVALVEGCPLRSDDGGHTRSCSPTLSVAPVTFCGISNRVNTSRMGTQPAGVVLFEYGAALAGLTLVTVNPSLQPAEASYILGQSRAAGVFLVPEVRGNPLMATSRRSRGTARVTRVLST